MKSTVIPPLSDYQRERIKRIVKSHYGFDADDHDIDWIDEMHRNHDLVLHDQRIISNLVTVRVSKILLKHRDKMGSLNFEEILARKLFFNYLTFASMSFIAGIPIATISLCRTAIDAGLRERIAEELAKKETGDGKKLPQKILEIMEKLENKKLGKLIEMAEENNLITSHEIEEFFKSLKLREDSGRKALDKYIHGDIGWIVKLIERIEDTEVIGAKDILDEKKILAESDINEIAVIALIGATRVAERLYFRS